jgi:hypothetical protein
MSDPQMEMALTFKRKCPGAGSGIDIYLKLTTPLFSSTPAFIINSPVRPPAVEPRENHESLFEIISRDRIKVSKIIH